MSKKYIPEISNPNFVFPNNLLWEYGLEIIHDINNNAVTGDISNFSASLSAGNINLSFDFEWFKNGAEPFITSANKLNLLSVHLMDPSKTYYKPWRTVGFLQDNNTALTTKTGTFTETITPAQMGVGSFTTGTYYFEIRMIGHKNIFPICHIATLN